MTRTNYLKLYNRLDILFSSNYIGGNPYRLGRSAAWCLQLHELASAAKMKLFKSFLQIKINMFLKISASLLVVSPKLKAIAISAKVLLLALYRVSRVPYRHWAIYSLIKLGPAKQGSEPRYLSNLKPPSRGTLIFCHFKACWLLNCNLAGLYFSLRNGSSHSSWNVFFKCSFSQPLSRSPIDTN